MTALSPQVKDVLEKTTTIGGYYIGLGKTHKDCLFARKVEACIRFAILGHVGDERPPSPHVLEAQVTVYLTVSPITHSVLTGVLINCRARRAARNCRGVAIAACPPRSDGHQRHESGTVCDTVSNTVSDTHRI